MQSRILLPGEIPKSYQRLNRVQVVPFRYKIIELHNKQLKQIVPIEKTILSYKPKIKKYKVPIQKTIIQYIPIKKQPQHRHKTQNIKEDVSDQEKNPSMKYQSFGMEDWATEKGQSVRQRKPFPFSKYCRMGFQFRQKYLHDNPKYDYNAVSYCDDWKMREWEQEQRCDGGCRWKGMRQREYEQSYSVDKIEKSTELSRSVVEWQLMRRKERDMCESDDDCD